jgi:putative acetyltransferase
MQTTLLRTNSENPDFIELVKLLDADLAILDGDEHPFFAQFNKIDKINEVVLAYLDGKAVGCGAIKAYAPGIVEVKRMFVRPETRGRGIAVELLRELENWAKELAYEKCILETGIKQVEAIRLYEKCGYTRIPNYPPYEKTETSRCFEKRL